MELVKEFRFKENTLKDKYDLNIKGNKMKRRWINLPSLNT